MSTKTPTIEYLDQLFPGQLLLAVLDAGHVLGMAKQTIRNKVADKTFPVAVLDQNNRRYVRKFDLARYIDELGQPPRPKRGRPRKAVPSSEVEVAK